MRSLYGHDLVLWSEQQAAALRQMDGMVSEVDWKRLALHVDETGQRAFVRTESALRAILAQAIAGLCDPGSLLRRRRIERVLACKSALAGEVGPTARARLDLDRIWQEAFDSAVTELDEALEGEKALGLVVDPEAATINVPPGIPHVCPFTIDELLHEEFTYDRAVEQLYMRLTSWRPKPAKDAA